MNHNETTVKLHLITTQTIETDYKECFRQLSGFNYQPYSKNARQYERRYMDKKGFVEGFSHALHYEPYQVQIYNKFSNKKRYFKQKS